MNFHILSFEGPDPYSRAGGIASRITGLSEALAGKKFPTDLWFIGDPKAPGHEARGTLGLHRWCQWISEYHPNGVYDGEDQKSRDYAQSLPPFMIAHQLGRTLAQGEHAFVLAEEWHTAEAVIRLDALLQELGCRDDVTILWNANNVFGFDRIDWPKLKEAAVITTVSRYMRQIMTQYRVEALVIPNGIEASALVAPPLSQEKEFHARLAGRTVLAKVARFDPDKRWLSAIDIIGEMKRDGEKPLLVARGGIESYGSEVLRRAAADGLRVVDRKSERSGAAGLLDAVSHAENADVVNLQSPLDGDARKLLFAASDCVLANSGHEPFGLVGLEAMAAGGLACTGCSGEDYALPGRNALVVQTNNPREFIGKFMHLKREPEVAQQIRDAGQKTAESYVWSEVIDRNIVPQLEMLAG